MTHPIDSDNVNDPSHHPLPPCNPPRYDEKRFKAKQNPPTKEEFDALAGLVSDLTLGREMVEGQLNELALGRESMQGVIVLLTQDTSKLFRRVDELQAKLKETISAVTKLAKGKSLGALGLPMEESWHSA